MQINEFLMCVFCYMFPPKRKQENQNGCLLYGLVLRFSDMEIEGRVGCCL